MRLARSLLALPPAPPTPARAPRTTRPAGPRPLLEARAAMRDGDHERALAAFDAAIAEQPRLPLAHLGRAITLFALGRHEEAGLALDEALSCGDDDGEVLLAVARACVTTGQYGLAMDVLGLAVGAFPTLAEMVSHDPGFVRLRDHPRFLQIVGEL